MSLLSRLMAPFRAKSQLVDQKRPISLRGVGIAGFPAVSSNSGEIIGVSSALSISTVWACVGLVAGTIGSLPLQTMRQRERYRDLESSHYLQRILSEQPNPEQSAVDFWEFMAASLELWGNAYAEIDQSSGRVTSLWPIQPAAMSVVRQMGGALRYTWTNDVGQSRQGDASSILHIRGFGGSAIGGLSTLTNARHTLGLARAADRAASGMFRNGMQPSGVLKFAEWLPLERREFVHTEMVERFLGAQNAGRPMVLEGGTDFERLTLNPDDAQMLETRKFSVEEVCRFFGVPPHMVGHTEKSTSWGTGLEQQTLAFQKFTLRRRLRRIEEAVRLQLMTPGERARGLVCRFGLDELLRGDTGARASYYQTMTQIGAMTINDVRRAENLPPVDGGDEPRIQMQNQPIGASNAEPEQDG